MTENLVRGSFVCTGNLQEALDYLRTLKVDDFSKVEFEAWDDCVEVIYARPETVDEAKSRIAREKKLAAQERERKRKLKEAKDARDLKEYQRLKQKFGD